MNTTLFPTYKISLPTAPESPIRVINPIQKLQNDLSGTLYRKNSNVSVFLNLKQQEFINTHKGEFYEKL